MLVIVVLACSSNVALIVAVILIFIWNNHGYHCLLLHYRYHYMIAVVV